MFKHGGGVMFVVSVFMMMLSAGPAEAQCEWQWPIGVDGPHGVRSLLGVQTGELPFESGPVLYAGGYFDEVEGMPANHIAKWDGSAWSAVGEGLPSHGRAMAVFNGELYAGSICGPGQANNGYVAKWDGVAWSMVAETNADVKAMLVFDDDGDGPIPPALYIGGALEDIDGLEVNGIARWDGTSWSTVGGGVEQPANGNQPPQPGVVRGMKLFDGGLLVGGRFTTAGGMDAFNVALWNGSDWLPMGNSPGVDEDETVQEFEIVEEALYASVCYKPNGQSNHVWYLAQWNPLPAPGGSWAALIDVGEFDLDRMASFDNGIGDGQSLHISGYFDLPAEDGVAQNIARWDEPTQSWGNLGEGCCGARVWAMVVWDDDGDGPNPPALYEGGARIKKYTCSRCTSAADCDDGDDCTFDTCDPAGGCHHTLLYAGCVSDLEATGLPWSSESFD